MRTVHPSVCFFFFFNDTATTEIYTLSLHDALPILPANNLDDPPVRPATDPPDRRDEELLDIGWIDRKSTRLNSSHLVISYAVFCLKKKKTHRHATLDPTSLSHLVDCCTRLSPQADH